MTSTLAHAKKAVDNWLREAEDMDHRMERLKADNVRLREALRRIDDICTSETGQLFVDDLAEISNLTDAAVTGKDLPPSWTVHT